MSFASRFKLGTCAAAAEDSRGPGELAQLGEEDVPQQLQVAAQPSQQRKCRLAMKLDGLIRITIRTTIHINIIIILYDIMAAIGRILAATSWSPLVGCCAIGRMLLPHRSRHWSDVAAIGRMLLRRHWSDVAATS